ncbi:MAG: bacterioferritin [Candidatus Omnitrophica bacterium]|nr:bacterioferritin [Candidatus Omnitrophota bacterium]
MGKKGREIIEIDIKPILSALRSAYADEWMAHYNYLHAAQIATGLNAPQVASMLKARSADELTHSTLIGERILELGGTLPADWSDIPKLANSRKFDLPKSASDLKGILKAVLKAEREAIDVYKKLLAITLHKDTVTHELAEELLADEVRDEEETENLIGE